LGNLVRLVGCLKINLLRCTGKKQSNKSMRVSDFKNEWPRVSDISDSCSGCVEAINFTLFNEVDFGDFSYYG
jgi:hypothetical protein